MGLLHGKKTTNVDEHIISATPKSFHLEILFYDPNTPPASVFDYFITTVPAFPAHGHRLSYPFCRLFLVSCLPQLGQPHLSQFLD